MNTRTRIWALASIAVGVVTVSAMPAQAQPLPNEQQINQPTAESTAAAQATSGGQALDQPITDTTNLPAPTAPVEPVAAPPSPPSPVTAPSAAPTTSPFTISGYVQGELHLQDPFTGDENPEGVNNRDLFQIRRGRIKLIYTYRLADVMLELDATNRGVRLQGGEAGIQIPWSDTTRSRLSIGLSIMPFGVDIQISSKLRYFAERSLLARHFFPSERDLGALLQGFLFDNHFRYQLGVVNGNTNTDALFPQNDGNGFKDVIARFGGVSGPLSFGASGYVGRGYIDGFADDAMTPTVNESTASFQFTRYALDLDARLTLPMGPLGPLDVYGEVAYALNMDRLTRASYPQPLPGVGGGFATSVANAHQLSWYIAATQDFGEYFAFGLRAEQFDPNTSVANNTVTAFSATALVLPTENTRIMFSYFASKQIPDEAWIRLQVRY